VSSAASTTVGRWIDRLGGRPVMSAGSILVAVGLLALSQVTHPSTYLAAWAFLGLAMRMNLYDAAFAALVQVTPSRGRRAISYLTLFGGFASSVFWPIGYELNANLGWRGTLVVFAATNLVVCLPLHWFGLARREAGDLSRPASGEAGAKPADAPLEGAARSIGMVLFGLIGAATAMVFGALAVHLVPILEATGLAVATAVFLASLKGVAQVAGRVWEIVLGHRLKPLDLGRISIAFLPLSFLVLMLGGANFWTAFAFTMLFGVSNGLVTIVRGAVPLALFGAKGYGEVLGILATPYLLLAALSPAAFALIVERWGYGAGEAVMLGSGLVAFLAMEVMALWYRRRR
jgi:predicted MFS family arabinose efflux permease